MDRRVFLKTAGLGTLALGASGFAPAAPTHLLSLSFDDGFRKSFHRAADIHEGHGLRACLNVIASGHLPSFKQVDEWIRPELMGSFDDWNDLKKRGHEIMPHSWKHLNLAKQKPRKAQKLIMKCLDYFEEHLRGYRNEEAVFNFPFNASTPALEEFLLERVLAVRSRMRYQQLYTEPMPGKETDHYLVCAANGPDNIDAWVETTVQEFLNAPGGWLILNVHGLDEEGWGPMTADYLDDLLGRLVKMPGLEILPVGKAMMKYTGA
ncbi:polysaccharide deacetylase family protein [Lewinella sp. W8]|uniref:polysaccharide deacetylase family protein n=1 Tax=Lewinella sp. W8 TaxID=2528208 RepID=UPI001068587D|nr:polysaccharide deacetylase family protein [Lewinella sp. W8]MTB50569.1 polysaccharide deacetylase family protein [Lewinella sp. W8]